MVDAIGARDLRARIAQECERQVEPFSDRFVVVGFFIGDGNEVDAEPADFPERMAQLRQVESSGGSPVPPVVMHQYRTGAQQPAQGDVVALFVAKLEGWRILPEHRGTVFIGRGPW
jgi:hypothetical protein